MAKPDHRPEIAVVIPTRSRETRLAFALEALAEQTLAPERFEVIVVRAADAAAGTLTEAPDGLHVSFLTSRAGPAVQRNIGWRAARASWVAFTDDDCRPAADWLERLLEARPGPETILQGRTEPDPDESHLLWGLARSWEITEPNDWFATCNVAYPRSLLERVGGFDERFPSAWGEDTDLGLRASESGAGLVYVDRALVWHAVLPRALPGALREARRWAATPTVVKRHPSHREGFYGRVFVSARHAYLPLALAALPAIRRRPLLAALAAAPYLKRTLDWRNPSPRRLLRQAIHLPARVAVDLAEMTAIARAAVRNRVLVL
jgi:GT2 family glycosyltransferase